MESQLKQIATGSEMAISMLKSSLSAILSDYMRDNPEIDKKQARVDILLIVSDIIDTYSGWID